MVPEQAHILTSVKCPELCSHDLCRLHDSKFAPTQEIEMVFFLQFYNNPIKTATHSFKMWGKYGQSLNLTCN